MFPGFIGMNEKHVNTQQSVSKSNFPVITLKKGR